MLISTPNIFDQGQVIDRQSDTLKPANRFVLGQHICQIISQSEPGSGELTRKWVDRNSSKTEGSGPVPRVWVFQTGQMKYTNDRDCI